MTEFELFELLRLCYMPDLKRTDTPNSRYDCYSTRWKMDIELKCRRKHYDELLIERDKYNALMKRAEEFETLAFYINSTPEGIWAFNLSDLKEPEWEHKGGLPKTTDFSNNRRMVKEVGYLHIKDGKQLGEVSALDEGLLKPPGEGRQIGLKK